jgi:arylsulfatase A-like enzyme
VNHLAGIGRMNTRKPDYEGYLNFRTAALPAILQDAGYHTFMERKWHLGQTNETSTAPRAFNKYYSLLQGGSGYFSDLPLVGPNPAMYYSLDKRLSQPEDFYSSKNFSKKITSYTENKSDERKPFFA